MHLLLKGLKKYFVKHDRLKEQDTLQSDEINKR